MLVLREASRREPNYGAQKSWHNMRQSWPGLMIADDRMTQRDSTEKDALQSQNAGDWH